MTLKRSIGTWGLLFAAVGGIIGSGWLFGPFYAAQEAGPAALLSWVIGGGLMMVIAMTFAELSSTFPVAGGTVRFLHLSHGPLVSYTMAWIGWLSAAAVAPIETMALLQYASNYFPTLMHLVHGTHVLSGMGFIIAAVLMLLMCVINAIGVHFLAKTNSLVVVLKLVVPVVAILVLFCEDFHLSNFTTHGFAANGVKGVLSALPTAGVIFSFIGYSPAIQLAGEAKNPQRSIPIAIIGALCFSIVLYVVLQVAFVGALKPSAFAHGWRHLSFVGDAGPFAGIMTLLGVVWLVKILYIDAAISPFGTALIYTASTARMCYAMGDNGYLPKPMMKLNKFSVPARILFLNYIIGLILFLPFPTWQNLVGFLVSALVFAYAVGPLALLVLRKTLPHQPRPFRVPAAKLVCLSAFYICNLIVYWTGWVIIAKMGVAIALGYVVLFFYRRSEQGKRLSFQWNKSWWIFIYIGLMVLVSYLGNFGGGRNIIPFGWDFLVIAVISWFIFECSQFCALASVHEDDLKKMGL
ncbi:MAG: APC family permease [Gammaproteobacteria bacterium]|nr:APC family permease [Gammaproteobacteria bacterium]